MERLAVRVVRVETSVLGWRLAQRVASKEQVEHGVGSYAVFVEAGRNCSCCGHVANSLYVSSSRCLSWTGVVLWRDRSFSSCVRFVVRAPQREANRVHILAIY